MRIGRFLQKESVFISKTEPNLRLDAAFTASVIKIKWISLLTT